MDFTQCSKCHRSTNTLCLGCDQCASLLCEDCMDENTRTYFLCYCCEKMYFTKCDIDFISTRDSLVCSKCTGYKDVKERCDILENKLNDITTFVKIESLITAMDGPLFDVNLIDIITEY